jgi:hypothetical protein
MREKVKADIVVLLMLNLPFLGQANKVVRNWHFGFASIPVFE